MNQSHPGLVVTFLALVPPDEDEYAVRVGGTDQGKTEIFSKKLY